MQADLMQRASSYFMGEKQVGKGDTGGSTVCADWLFEEADALQNQKQKQRQIRQQAEKHIQDCQQQHSATPDLTAAETLTLMPYLALTGASVLAEVNLLLQPKLPRFLVSSLQSMSL